MANFKFLETEYQLKKLKPKYNNFWYAGKLKGYWCLISVNFYEKKCSITIGAHKEDTHKSLIEILKDEPNLKKAKITTEDATVTISYKIPFFTSSNRKKFDEIIETVISNLKRNDFSTGGFLDGTNDSTLSIVEVGQKYFYLTDSEYKKKSEDLELKREEIKVTDKEVEEHILEEAKKNARIEEVSKKSKKGHILNIDFEGFTKNEKEELVAFAGGKGEGYDLKLGSNTFIPGFEDQLIGTKKDEEKEINVKFPKEYHAKELAGKDAIFKVKINTVKEEIVPKIDEELAKDLGYETLEELQKETKENLELEKETKQKRELEVQAGDKVLESSKVEVSHEEIHHTFHQMMEGFARQGISMEMFAQMLGKTPEELHDEYEKEIEKNTKLQYILVEIANKEKLVVEDKEIDAELERKSAEFSDKPSVEQLRKYEPLVREVTRNIQVKKAMEFILANAKYTK